METIKIIKKTYINKPRKVYDIEVNNEHHYFLKNGILSHNSVGSFISMDVMSGGGGPLYNASVILFLYKSQLKTGDDISKNSSKHAENVGMKKSGIIVRSKPFKNRFARPIQIRFHISFYKGMNPYVGLEKFISWKNCGIERGKIYNEKEYEKWSKEEKKEAEKNNYEFEKDGKKMYFYPKETARKIIVRHLGEAIKPEQLFTPRILTKKILKELDEKVIKPEFNLPEIGDMYDLEGYADELVDDDGNDSDEDFVDNKLNNLLKK